MSGGHYDYKQYQLNYIADEMLQDINCSNGKHQEDCYWINHETMEKELSCVCADLTDDFKQEMLDVEKELRKLYIRIKRIGWVLSGDDSVESWRERQKEDLDDLENERSCNAFVSP
jgi:hypothetical protein